MKRKLLRILLVLGVLALLRFGLPLGFAAWHYSSTPTMREWVRERPVEDRVWDGAGGDLRESERRVLEMTAPPSEPERFAAWTPSLRFEHGDEVLLDLALEVRYEATEVDAWEERGVGSESYGPVTLHATRCDLDPEFHAIVVLTLTERAEGDRRAPSTKLDVFVLAGPGGVELVERTERVGGSSSYDLSIRSLAEGFARDFTLKALLLGILHPTGDPPPSGIGYHAHSTFTPTWNRVPGGSQGASYGMWRFTGTTRQYSVLIHAESKGEAPFEPGSGSSLTSEVNLSYRWNGEVW
ncbi:hypothetical protein Poly30_04430 [Planctomycetes bacterium Poly30]|uniref:Uncharacterized protein n=1 Tax=Saltatorellus ferox TaxID=2528018 RepID=A0A518ELJ1_9BACT|nr:hypothetical protein Poly30_04430 [Planctomycetes bacterium Poly30]